ncbi:MAG: SDR family NAD(P)-dependent oxidoreductase [Candidatus Competibacteraceae bacterium]|nr:SDR family NAD(P)-dependent oxidoreductase [Candidatus Competibacteraceae bacterium]
MNTKPYALITGGTSGIGWECARILAARNLNLLIVSNQSEELLKCKALLEMDFNIHVLTHFQDLSQNNAADDLYRFCLDHKLEIEVLINNAGFFFFSEVVLVPVEKASRMIQLHIHTTSLLCVLMGRHMKERGKGYIMNVASIASYKDFPGIAFYAATKKFIRGFTRSLRTEMKYYGVKVTALCPGATATNLYDPNVIDVKKGMRWGIMMTAAQVAQSGIRGMYCNKSVVVPGFLTKIMLFLSILTPHWLIYAARVKWRKLFDPHHA